MGNSQSVTLQICNARGLHARAAAKFVKTVAEYKATISVAKDGQEVSGASIMGLMMLAAAKGTEISVQADGTDAQEALGGIRSLVEGKFGEDE